MRHDFGNRFQDEVEVPDRHPFSQEQFHDRLQAGEGRVRRADVIQQLLVLRIQPVEQVAHVLVGQELRQVVADHLAQVCQDHRVVFSRLQTVTPLRPGRPAAPKGRHAKCGFAGLIRRHRQPLISVRDHQKLTDLDLLRGDDRAVDLDLVAFRIDRQAVDTRMSGTTKPYCSANLRRILATRRDNSP
jgi:hypothetical protein